MAHKKGVGSSRNGRDSQSKRLGMKVSDGQLVKTGMIIRRQRGTPMEAGRNVGLGRDHTLYALVDGHVKIEWARKGKRCASVYPLPQPIAEPAPTPATV